MAGGPQGDNTLQLFVHFTLALLLLISHSVSLEKIRTATTPLQFDTSHAYQLPDVKVEITLSSDHAYQIRQRVRRVTCLHFVASSQRHPPFYGEEQPCPQPQRKAYIQDLEEIQEQFTPLEET